MEVRHMLSALWRTRTGPLLIAVQIAIALAVLVNVTYLIEQRLVTYTKPTGMDIDTSSGCASSPSPLITIRRPQWPRICNG